MPRKKMHDASKACTCTLCGAEARSIPGTPHRRCGGKAGAPRRPKHGSSAGARGKWV